MNHSNNPPPQHSPPPPPPFSFHCTICFEPFTHTDRPPVVLPCGHTFLCAPCSKRLKRCMECRASLFLTVTSSSETTTTKQPLSNDRNTTVPGRGSQGRGGRVSPHQPCPTVVPATNNPIKDVIPLPLPRNVLLLSLMEMVERETRAQQRIARSNPQKNIKENSSLSGGSPCSTEVNVSQTTHLEDLSPPSSPSSSIPDSGPLRGEDIDPTPPLNWSIISISSYCGTYAVTDQAGLLVLPRKPTNISGRNHNYTSSLRKSAHHSPPDKTPETTPRSRVTPRGGGEGDTPPKKWVKSYPEAPLPYELPFGSRVQVVTIEEGWVKLARNGGFLYVESNQLVKVGPPMDKACEIEAMLMNLEVKRKEVDSKKGEIDRIEAGLEHEFIQQLLEHPLPDKKNYELDLREEKENDVPVPSNKKDVKTAVVTLSPPPSTDSPDNNANLRTPSPPNDNSPNASLSAATNKGQPSPDTQQSRFTNLGIPRLSPPEHTSSSSIVSHTLRPVVPPPPPPPPPALSRGPSPSNSVRSQRSQPPPSSPLSPHRFYNNSHSGSSTPRQSRAAAAAARSERPPVSPIEHEIDFRTGLSGHCALLSTKSYAPHPTPDERSRSHMKMMSNHHGIGIGGKKS